MPHNLILRKKKQLFFRHPKLCRIFCRLSKLLIWVEQHHNTKQSAKTISISGKPECNNGWSGSSSKHDLKLVWWNLPTYLYTTLGLIMSHDYSHPKVFPSNFSCWKPWLVSNPLNPAWILLGADGMESWTIISGVAERNPGYQYVTWIQRLEQWWVQPFSPWFVFLFFIHGIEILNTILIDIVRAGDVFYKSWIKHPIINLLRWNVCLRVLNTAQSTLNSSKY